MDAVEILDLEAAPAALDEAASATPGIATYCSASDWTLSAIAHLHAGRTPVVYRRDDAWVALSHGVHDDVGPYLQPLEADWGFASPLLGPDPRFAVELLGEVLRGAREWRVALLTGLPVGVASQVCTAMDRNNRVVMREGIRCQVARIDDGTEGFLARRSAKHRANLRRDRRRAMEQGVYFELVEGGDADALLARILAVERRSWKFRAGQSVLQSPRYRAFYGGVIARALKRGALRVVFARRHETDLAYVFGGIIEDRYRGFQLGYDDDEATLGLGNQVQFAMIEHLAAEGVRSYDLGMEMAYKARWADELLRLYTVVIVKRG